MKLNHILWQTIFIATWLELTQASRKRNLNDKTKDAHDPRQKYKVDSSIFHNVESYAGFIPINEEYDSNIFFWYFPKPVAGPNTPWIIWLQGGPGISSLVGIFELNGPFEIKDDKVQLRNITWTSDYSVLYIDNPVGAGFSYTRDNRGYTTTDYEAGQHLMQFLGRFLNIFPEVRDQPLFVAGESYAGKYVPILGWNLHRHKDEPQYKLKLKGLMIGNGLIDTHSMMHYSDLCQMLGLLDDDQAAELKKLEIDAIKFLDEGKMLDSAMKFNYTIEYIKKHSSINIMNFNENGGMKFSFLEFLKRRDVRDAIHVGNATFEVNNQLVCQNMLADFMNSTKPFVEELLEHYGVLCYSGQLDVILPYWGSKHMYTSLKWSRAQEYHTAARTSMKLNPNGPVVGYQKSGGGFKDVLIRAAGHMAPKEKPEEVKCMIDEFIKEFSGGTGGGQPCHETEGHECLL